MGPFASKNLSNFESYLKNPIQQYTLEVDSLITPDESCNQYTVFIPAETFKKTGFYEMQVYV